MGNYRDAVQYVHDQTIRHMNKGLTPDELVHGVRLPPHLAEYKPCARVLRQRAPGGAQHLSGLPRLVRGRSSGAGAGVAPGSRAARGGAHGRARPCTDRCAAGLRRGRCAMGRGARNQTHSHRSRRHGGAAAQGGGVSQARLCRDQCNLAQLVSIGRARA